MEEKRMQRFLKIRLPKSYLKARHAAPCSYLHEGSVCRSKKQNHATASSFQDKPNFHCLSANLHWHAVHCLLLCLLIKRNHEIINAYKLELSRRKTFFFILKFLIPRSFVP